MYLSLNAQRLLDTLNLWKKRHFVVFSSLLIFNLLLLFV